jgi:hypothetical protein
VLMPRSVPPWGARSPNRGSSRRRRRRMPASDACSQCPLDLARRMRGGQDRFHSDASVAKRGLPCERLKFVNIVHVIRSHSRCSTMRHASRRAARLARAGSAIMTCEGGIVAAGRSFAGVPCVAIEQSRVCHDASFSDPPWIAIHRRPRCPIAYTRPDEPEWIFFVTWGRGAANAPRLLHIGTDATRTGWKTDHEQGHGRHD